MTLHPLQGQPGSWISAGRHDSGKVLAMTDIRGIIFDIDGVLEFQGSVYPGAVETLEKLRDRGFALRFLTNSTLKSRASCAARLRRAGYRVSDDEVITASSATAAYLRTLGPRTCWVMLDREGFDEFKKNESYRNVIAQWESAYCWRIL